MSKQRSASDTELLILSSSPLGELFFVGQCTIKKETLGSPFYLKS
ncbi:hypothetical protein SynMITS9220_01697 [Synechococcus sp. MIT S9220]|nr:hypothetical protein SynMITS9220_01697 [Synechococcus sp. MIT S9220]